MDKPTFAPSFWQGLGAACRFGPVEPEVVMAWFDLKWPVYQSYGYKLHARAVAKWWGRVAPYEIDDARELLHCLDDVAEQHRLDALYLTLNKDNPPTPVTKPRRRFEVITGGRDGA